MDRKKLFLVQTLAEALIPVLGYCYWGWDLSFILLFYLLDYVLAFGIFVAKGRKRAGYARNAAESRLLVRRIAAGFGLMVVACAAIGFGVVFLQPGLSWPKRIVDFLLYEDMGIAQGYVLVPLLLLNGILLYRRDFLATARYRLLNMEAVTRPFIRQGLILLGVAGIFMGVAALIPFPQEVAIFAFIAGTSVYRWLTRS